MYTLLRTSTAPELLRHHAPTLTAAFIIASLFYKFGSFALECLAFLATWFALDATLSSLRPSRR